MPLLYEGTCANCDHRTAMMPAGYGAVFVDEPVEMPQRQVAAAVVEQGSPAAFSEDDHPHLVILAHPGESWILKKTGYSWNDLLWEGRYIATQNRVCRECGTVFPKRRLRAPGAVGCVPVVVLPILVSGLAGGVAAGWISRGLGAAVGLGLFGFIVGLWLCLIIVVMSDWLADRYVRRRHAARAAQIDTGRGCPHCRSDATVRVDRARVVPCRACGERKMAFRTAGVS